MDKSQAMQAFWENFGLTAYDQNTVPDDAQMPYITYEMGTGAIEDRIPLSASIWYHGTSWKPISLIADQISEFIGYGFYKQKIDGGYMLVYRGTPFAQRMSDDDDSVRRIYINILVEFLTAD